MGAGVPGARSAPLRIHTVIDSMTAGGAEMLLADLSVGARSTGFELSVSYLSPGVGEPAAERLRERGVEPVLLPIDGLLKRSSVARVAAHLDRMKPDVVHTQLAYADAVGGLAARRLGIPSVSTVHVMEWERGLREQVRTRLISAARRRCASRVITVSDAARRVFLDAGWDSPERVSTVHNGIAAEPRAGVGAAVRGELGFGAQDLVVAMVGVLREGKGHAEAIEAVERLREVVPETRLLIVGDGPERREIAALAERLGPAAVLAGHRSDVMAVLDAVDVLVHPSRVDAFPTVLLEAMAAGVPVVATRVGGIPEIVVGGETGALVEAPPSAPELAGALRHMLADARHRRRLGAAGRARFERSFTAEQWARRLRAVYDSVLDGAAAGSAEP